MTIRHKGRIISGNYQAGGTLDNFYANIDLDNLSDKGNEKINSKLPSAEFYNKVDTFATKDMVDGQWIQSYRTIMTNVKAVGAYTYDLSTYLPNDGYDYEVLFWAMQNSSNVSHLTFGTVASPYTNYNCFWANLVTSDTTNTPGIQSMQFLLPIDTTRRVYMQISNEKISTVSQCVVIGYRRIGKGV